MLTHCFPLYLSYTKGSFVFVIHLKSVIAMRTHPDLLPLQKNLALKRLFDNRGLDLDAVMEFTPLDLDLENRRLQALAEFVIEYDRFGSREAMEAVQGGLFPPVFPAISPESDWHRFELWLQGEAVRKPLGDMLPDKQPFRKPEEIGDEAIEAELERLLDAIESAQIGIALCDGLPPQLLYAYLYEKLGDIFEVDGGGWVIDGCSGYCPGCIQRPWCETGQSSCWDEDEEAGKMQLPEALAPYVSASPQSLALLRQAQALEDAARVDLSGKEFEDLFGIKPGPDEDWTAKQN